MKKMKSGEKIMDAQISARYESNSGFKEALLCVMGAEHAKSLQDKTLKASWLDTPLGPMLAIADEKILYLLEFIDGRGLEREIELLRKRTKSVIIPGETQAINHIKKELEQYFLGKLKIFKTPLFLMGSPFQQRVWEELKKIPLGATCAYADIAKNIGKPTAYRAVANANGANQLAIIIPCHRVINANNHLGGYGGGVSRKKWLIEHEQRFKN